MTNSIAPIQRTGQSTIPLDAARVSTLMILVQDRPGSVDRVIGVLRRRRAIIQTIVLGRSESPDVVRITVTLNDSEVGLDQLIEQLRKVVDVRKIMNLAAQQAITRELALIKVKSTPANHNEIIEHGQQLGAHPIEVTEETVTLEMVGSAEKVQQLIELLQGYGISEIARSGSVTIPR